jgi:hypothetical protein
MLELAQEQAQYLCDRSMSSVAFKEFLEKLFPPRFMSMTRACEIVQYPRARDYALDSLQHKKALA